jgi:uncharacterized membrane-anchored protein
MSQLSQVATAKVPALTIGFWMIKVLATTVGETGGDAVSMSMNLGYLLGTVIFFVLFAIAVGLQVFAKTFKPPLYWLTIIASTTVGTTLADFADRSLGIGYLGGSLLLLTLLLCSLLAWHMVLGSIDVSSIVDRRSELFYWFTIMCSQTLGTALGDWTADSAGMGYLGAAMLFGSLLAAIVAAYALTRISRTMLFWAAFVLTRPFGAVVGDFMDKSHAEGGLALSRYSATAVLLLSIVLLVVFVPQRPATQAH